MLAIGAVQTQYVLSEPPAVSGPQLQAIELCMICCTAAPLEISPLYSDV